MKATSTAPQNHDWKEERRQRAWELKQQGWTQHLIAEAFGVSEAAVSKWLRVGREQGPEALRARPRPGAPPKLSPAQLKLVPDFLAHGAEAYGFRGEVWNCARVAHVIEAEFGVRYHPAHVSRLLKQLDWTPQKPLTQAAQRDEAQIVHWRQAVWPRLRDGAQQEGRIIVFVDEAAFYLLPGVVKSYAPEGEPPVIHVPQMYDHLSMMSAVTPAGALYTLVRDAALTSHESVWFIKHLLRHLDQPLLLIWDGAPIHRTGEVPPFLAEMTSDLVWVEPLPPYAPDLNPDEGVWQHLKHIELANLACQSLPELRDELDLAVSRLRQKPDLILAFFANAGLVL